MLDHSFLLLKGRHFFPGADIERRSRWDRWGLTRGKRDKTISQPDIPASIARENGSLRSRQYTRLTSGIAHLILRISQ